MSKEMEHELELLRVEVKELKSLLQSEVKELKSLLIGQDEATKKQVEEQENTAAGILAFLVWVGSGIPGVCWVGMSLEVRGLGTELGTGLATGLIMAHLILPGLFLTITLIMPLMDRDRLTLEAVMSLGYGSLIIFGMTKRFWPALVQALMVFIAIFLRHLHRREIHRRQESHPVELEKQE
ncbi:hypothetical protein CKK34_3402 [Yarrowia sp. E02]|nr:hypothetical protein CKK34_3402 [Yarrowia sp. E02]